ncbi:MAG: hypothetical protein R3336_06905, partial [Phycisphaeraceae bacterium]|nr:hypothetical protein [Phycisphaeraceae bacterium]
MSPQPTDPDAPAAPTGRHPAGRRWLTWLLLIACLLPAGLSMPLRLGDPAVGDPAEARSIVLALHTRAGAPDSPGDTYGERFVPVYNGRRQWDQHPGTPWLLAGVFEIADRLGFGQEITDRILQARWTSIVAVLLMLAGVYLAGYTIGNVRTAALACLASAACPLLVLNARQAGPVPLELATSTLAIAAALWAI